MQSIIRGAYFGPVTLTVAAKNAIGTVPTISSAYVRLHVDGVGIHDSTVANGQIVVNDTAKTVTWSMPQAVTATLPVGEIRGELVLVDPSGEQRIPAEGGRFALTVGTRASAP